MARTRFTKDDRLPKIMLFSHLYGAKQKAGHLQTTREEIVRTDLKETETSREG